MNTSKIKTKARIILDMSHKSALTVSIISVAVRLLFAVCALFCIYTLTELKYYFPVSYISYRCVIYYVLFTCGVIFSLWLFIVCGFSQRRWFIKNDGTLTIKNFFYPMPLLSQIKIVYIAFLRAVLSAFCYIFYLLPCTAVAFITLDTLVNKGIDRTVLLLCFILFVFLFFSGLFFAFVSSQRFAFCEEVAAQNPMLTINEIISFSRLKSDGICFELARFKLSFALWFILCLFIFPIGFVAPYYRQSFAVYAQTALAAESRQKPFTVRKPVIHFRLADKIT